MKLTRRNTTPEVNVDVAAVVSQFLSELSSFDIVVEFIQNELDANSSKTEIVFGERELTCHGNGTPIEASGWERLRYVLGAGGVVAAKQNGIGSKNHGLRSAFLIGDDVYVQSDGQRIDLTVRGDHDRPQHFYPAAWRKEIDETSPTQGVRITVPYRTEALEVPERNPLEAMSPQQVAGLFRDAVAKTSDRFICASKPGKSWQYEILIRHGELASQFQFRCHPAKDHAGLFVRTCILRENGGAPRLVHRRLCAPFEIKLADDDKAKVPALYRSGQKILGELSWNVGTDLTPQQGCGGFRYPIAYPTDQVRNGWGFDISGPFISGRARHTMSDDSRNVLVRRAGLSAFVDLLAKRLIPYFGPSALKLATNADFRDYAAEQDLASLLLRTGGLPIATASKRTKKSWSLSTAGSLVALSIPASAGNRISSPLAAVASSKFQALHPQTPADFVSVLVRLAPTLRANLLVFDEKAAAQEVFITSAPAVEVPVTSTWLGHCQIVLRELDAARARRTLPADFMRQFEQRGRLPTRSGSSANWNTIRRAPKQPPSVPGVSPPNILHASLEDFSVLKDGVGKIGKFDLDDYVSNRSFTNVASEGRRLFFSWLSKGHSDLTPKTLSMIAEYPIWPGIDESYRKLSAYCWSPVEIVRKVVHSVRPAPHDGVVNFSGLRRSASGALFLRKHPLPEEVSDWHAAQMAQAIEAEAANKPSEVIAIVGAAEEALDQLRKLLDLDVSDAVRGHLSVSQTGKLRPVTELHLALPLVTACGLLPEDIAQSKHTELLSALGAFERPHPPALIRALRSKPDQDRLFTRLRAYKDAGRNLSDLTKENIILVRGKLRSPGDLALGSSTAWWGEWKVALDTSPRDPDSADLLQEAGVVRQTLREDLSQGFFAWLSNQSAATQAKHLSHVVRHWSERRNGPSRWVRDHQDLECIPVNDGAQKFELISLRQALSPNRRVFVPDFPALQGQILASDTRIAFTMINAPNVDGSIIEQMRNVGIRSLRDAVGRPRKIASESDLKASYDLDNELAKLKSREVIRKLSRLLPQFDVPLDSLEHKWRQRISDLNGVRIADEFTAAFALAGREYVTDVPHGVDESTGLVCIAKNTDLRSSFYEAAAQHIFKVGSSTLLSYGLNKAVNAELDDSLLKDWQDTVDELALEDQEPSEPADLPRSHPPSPAPAKHDSSTTPRRGHGLRPKVDISAPSPRPVSPIANPTYVSAPVPEQRPPAQSQRDSRRNSVEELEQINELKSRHYSWHCQACLGTHEIAHLVPSGTYVHLPEYRRDLLEAHHVTHLQNDGGLGGANLLILCKFHHDLLGDQLSRQGILAALASAAIGHRRFPSGEDSIEFAGLLVKVRVSANPYTATFFFTREHADAWLALSE